MKLERHLRAYTTIYVCVLCVYLYVYTLEYIHTCLCVYVCTRLCACVGMCVYICVHTHSHVCMCVQICVHVCICVYTCVHVCMCVHICVHVCMYVCVCIYILIPRGPTNKGRSFFPDNTNNYLCKLTY